jgi:hypothetical protein
MNRLLFVAVAVAFVSACNSSPSSPSVAPPPTPQPVVTTVAGTVWESTITGRQPLPGVGIDLSPEFQYWPPTTTTDAQGHYQVTTIHGTGKVRAELAGYSQPCRVPVTATTGIDVYMVSNALLATTGIPSSMPIVPPTLTGLVFEQTPQGRRPIVGATVIGDFSYGYGWAPSATTQSDATGRYLLCAVQSVYDAFGVVASAPGYAEKELGVDIPAISTFDIELAPNSSLSVKSRHSRISTR